jgi:hypothetical protein
MVLYLPVQCLPTVDQTSLDMIRHDLKLLSDEQPLQILIRLGRKT